MDKILNFVACTYKSKKIAHSQQNFAPSHNDETVTFRNFGTPLYYLAKSSSTWHQYKTGRSSYKHHNPVHHINRQPWHSFIPGHVNIQFALSQDPWPKDPKPAAAKAPQSTSDPGRTGQQYQDQEYQNKDYQGEDYLNQDYQATDDYLEDESEEKREEQELAIDIRSSNKKKQSRRNGYGK